MFDGSRRSGWRVRAQSRACSRDAEKRQTQGATTLGRYALVKLEFGFTYHVADLHAVFGIVDFPGLFLRSAMFGVRAPGTHSLFVLELDDGNPLAVFGKKAFMRNVAGHRLRQFDHAVDKGDVFLARPRAQAGTKNSDDHIESPCRRMLAQPDMLDQFQF